MATEEKPRCKSFNSLGERCRNRATRTVIGPGVDCCDVAQHAEKLRRGEGIGLGGDTGRPASAAAPSPSPALSLEDLPIHEGPEQEPVASVETTLEVDPDLFSAPEEPAPPVAEQEGVDLAQLCTTEGMKEYLELLSMKLDSDGKKPLTRREIETGAPIFAQIGQRLFKTSGPANPWLLLVGWLAVVIGARYPDELRTAIGGAVRFSVNFFRRVRGLPPLDRPEPAPVAAAAAAPSSSVPQRAGPPGDPDAPQHPTRGWLD